MTDQTPVPGEVRGCCRIGERLEPVQGPRLERDGQGVEAPPEVGGVVGERLSRTLVGEVNRRAIGLLRDPNRLG